MTGVGLISPIVVVSGICSGMIIGITIPTDTEREKRRVPENRWLPFSNSTSLGFIFNQIILLVLVGSAVTATGMTILYIGDAYPLSRYDRITLCFSWLMGAAVAKWVRYCYWKSYF